MKRTLLFLATLFFSVSLMAQSSEIENDEDGDPLYFKDQFIVSFNPVFMNLTAIDDTLVQEGPLSDFVNLDTLQLLIDSGYLDTTGFFNTYVDFSLLTAHKVFKRLTSQITYSITRLGDTIEMPKFWATLLIEWPNDALITPPQACDSLNTFYPLIQHAELNWVAKVDGAPNDTRYSADQASLHNTASHSNAHINIESAWDVEVGRDYVKVGVFDTGIRWAHEDFGDGTFAGSKIADGFDYVNWQHVSQTTSYTNAHGTQCAGIIGALRNNNLGVSGIAGGDGANSNPGVSLYSMKVLNGSGLGYASTVADAMVEGVSWNPSQNYGYGLHILNCSFGFGKGDAGVFSQAVEFGFKNNAILVASRGNQRNSLQALDKFQYPGCLRDPVVINVGATDENRQRASFSLISNGLDIMAPGVDALVTTTGNGAPDYSTFNGTSASAPHVTGVVSLLASYMNSSSPTISNIAPEDAEYILEKTADDINNTGYDQYTGWGLLDANTALHRINAPFYKIEHFQKTVALSNATLVATNQSVVLLSPFGNLAAGTYPFVDIYQVTTINTHTLPSGVQIIDKWMRNSSCNNIWSGSNPVVPLTNGNILGCNSTSCAMSGFIYRFKGYDMQGKQIADNWYPASLSGSAKFAYSVYTFDPNATSVKNVDQTSRTLKIYPNPANTQLTIRHSESIQNVTIIDILGQTVLTFSPNASSKETLLDVSSLAKGIYFCSLTTPTGIITRKIQIN